MTSTTDDAPRARRLAPPRGLNDPREASISSRKFGGSVEPTDPYYISQAVEGGRTSSVTVRGAKLMRFYDWNGSRYEIEALDDNFGVRLYSFRNGKSYQADIEAHVAAYRGHIPDYVGDGAWLAKGIAKLTPERTVLFNHGQVVIDVGYDTELVVTHDDNAIAFWNAAIRACGYND